VFVLVCRSKKKEYSDESLIYTSSTRNCLNILHGKKGSTIYRNSEREDMREAMDLPPESKVKVATVACGVHAPRV
jgi:hypothetical protein